MSDTDRLFSAITTGRIRLAKDILSPEELHIFDDDEDWTDEDQAAYERLMQRLSKKESLWQPIETAPKDGTEILGWPVEGGDNNIAIVYYFFRGWCSGDYGADPTHWMPLPKPPDED